MAVDGVTGASVLPQLKFPVALYRDALRVGSEVALSRPHQIPASCWPQRERASSSDNIAGDTQPQEQVIHVSPFA